MKMLIAYDWPGNIRELKNVVERAIILSGSKHTVLPEHLTACATHITVPNGFSLAFDEEPELEEIEKKYLGLLLKRYSGHRTKIAKILGISERSVYRMLDKYGYKQ